MRSKTTRSPSEQGSTERTFGLGHGEAPATTGPLRTSRNSFRDLGAFASSCTRDQDESHRHLRGPGSALVVAPDQQPDARVCLGHRTAGGHPDSKSRGQPWPNERSRGTETGTDDRNPRNHGGFSSTPGGTRTPNLLIRSQTDPTPPDTVQPLLVTSCWGLCRSTSCLVAVRLVQYHGVGLHSDCRILPAFNPPG